ncbi:complement C1q-like protein 4 [Daphnia carinata]|uniref:complement C1q-like protein 4 n=1 Tax=Daphnia carinata TaxID=120202 RepID=UPI002868E055|nr:complement C1q-like protein 4 [Daphnia carinata]
MAGQKIKLNDLTRNLAMSTTPTTMGKVPSSCADLKSLGYQKSGIFSFMGNKQVESVYCDFTKPNDDAAFETWIGIVDTKTKRVYFHAQRNSKFDALNIIPFEKLRTNVGEAMELTGIFTAPVPGTYFFAYSGVSFATSQARVDLETKVAPDGDWFRVGEAYATDGNYETYSLQSTLRLSKGDQIRLKLSEGKLHEDAAYHFTNFVGLLLDEDL